MKGHRAEESQRIETAKKLIEAISKKGWEAHLWHKADHVRVYLELRNMKMGYVSVRLDGAVKWSLQGDEGYHHQLDDIKLSFFTLAPPKKVDM